MEAYETLGILGEGTYGVVIKARHRATGKLVAIKRFKQTDEDDHVRKTSTREVRMLQQLKHPNVVRLEEVFRREGKLYLVFEYIDNTILQVLESTTRGIPPRELRSFIYQLLRGLEFCHAHNVIHRDVKPENVLIDQSGMLKLCDFGFARQMTSKGKYTDYVATRWYRAPELLVGDVSYGRPVDVWALGCMFAELSDGQPLFPGESDLDQLCLIIQTCGNVPERMVSIFEHNPLYRNVSYPHTGIVYTLQERYHRQSEDWLEFLYACLHPDPAKRLTCSELMALPYFNRDGFRERYEQELRAISGLPLLRTNPTGSAPTPTRRSLAEQLGAAGGPKTLTETTPSSKVAAAAHADNATAVTGKTSKSNALGSVAVGGGKGGTTITTTTNSNNAASLKRSSIDAAASTKAKSHESTLHGDSSGAGFLPMVPHAQGGAAAAADNTVQLPHIIAPSTTNRGGGAGQAEGAGQLSVTSQYGSGPVITPDTTPSPPTVSGPVTPAESGRGGKAAAGKGVSSRSGSGTPSPKHSSLASSVGGGVVNKTMDEESCGPVAGGAASHEPSRRRSYNADGEGESTAAAADGGDGGGGGPEGLGGGAEEPRRSSRSIGAIASPRSPSLASDGKPSGHAVSPRSPQAEKHATKSGGGNTKKSGAAPAAGGGGHATQHRPIPTAAAAASSYDAHATEVTAAPPTLLSSHNISNAAHLASKRLSGPLSLTPLAERLPDLSSPGLQLPVSQHATAPHGSPESGGAGDIPKPLNSLDGLSVSPPSANPLALPQSRERGTSRLAPVAKARRTPSRESERAAPHTQTSQKKKVMKRRKEPPAPARGSSRGSSGRSAPGCSPQEQILECMRARGGNAAAGGAEGSSLQTAKASSASVSAFKLTTPRSPSYAADDGDDDDNDSSASDATSPHSVAAHGQTGAAAKRVPESRGSIPRKDRRSKPLQPASSSPEIPPRQPPLAHASGAGETASRTSATLLALTALRESTATLHQTAQDALYADKYGHGRHQPGHDYGVPLPPKTQAKDAVGRKAGGGGGGGGGGTRARKPLGVYSLHNKRRSIEDSEAAGGGGGGGGGGGAHSVLQMPDPSGLVSLPSSQYGGFAVPFRRTSKTGSNAGLSNPSLHTQTTSTASTATPQQLQLSSTAKRARKKRSSISGDLGGVALGNPYATGGGTSDEHSSRQMPLQSEKASSRRREGSGGSRRMLPAMYSAATAASARM